MERHYRKNLIFTNIEFCMITVSNYAVYIKLLKPKKIDKKTIEQVLYSEPPKPITHAHLLCK